MQTASPSSRVWRNAKKRQLGSAKTSASDSHGLCDARLEQILPLESPFLERAHRQLDADGRDARCYRQQGAGRQQTGSRSSMRRYGTLASRIVAGIQNQKMLLDRSGRVTSGKHSAKVEPTSSNPALPSSSSMLSEVGHWRPEAAARCATGRGSSRGSNVAHRDPIGEALPWSTSGVVSMQS